MMKTHIRLSVHQSRQPSICGNVVSSIIHSSGYCFFAPLKFSVVIHMKSVAKSINRYRCHLLEAVGNLGVTQVVWCVSDQEHLSL